MTSFFFMDNKSKYLARLGANPYRTAMLKEIQALKNVLLQRGQDVAVNSGVIFDLGLAAVIAEMRRLVDTSDFLMRTKEVKLEKDAAKVIQDYGSDVEDEGEW